MKTRSKSMPKFYTLMALLALSLNALGVAPVLAAQTSTPLPSVKQFLNSDGTLNTGAGYTGSLDISNYSVTLDAAHGPVFSPLLSPAPNAWNALGVGLNSGVYAIAISGTNIYAGGQFTDAGGDVNADFIAKWNGSAWSALGTTPLNNTIYAIAVSGTNVYAGGNFTDAGGDLNADKIAKWDGSTWSALGGGLNSAVIAIAVSGTDVYAGGYFTTAGGDINADYMAKWNGSTWSALGTTPMNSVINVITISGTNVYAGGFFNDAGGDANADYIAKWNGSTWSALGATPLNGGVYAIAVSGSNVYAGGIFTTAGGVANADKIAKWNGSAWSALGATPLNNGVYAIAISGTSVYAGGGFTTAGGVVNADYIAKWNGSAWSALGAAPLNNTPNAIAIGGVDVYAVGAFTNAGGDVNADFIAKFIVPKERALNGGFNKYIGSSRIPASWKAVNFSTSDGKFTITKKEGSASVKLLGATGKTKTLTQAISLHGAAGDPFTFSYWAKGSAIPKNGLCQGEIFFYSGTTSKGSMIMKCPTGTYSWKNVKLTFIAPVAYTKIAIKFTYSKVSGTIWLDLASLMK